MSLNFGRKMTIFIDDLGAVELRYVSFGDMIEFDELIRIQIPDRLFVAKILVHQITAPTVGLEVIYQLPDPQLLALAQAFITFEHHTFEYFLETGNFFKDFKQALVIKNEKDKEELQDIIRSAIGSVSPVQTTLDAFRNQYSHVIKQALDGTSYIFELSDQMTKAVSLISETQKHISREALSAFQQAIPVVKIVTESLAPQIDFWQRWTEANANTFKSFGRFWSDFYSRYSIAESEAVEILRKYKWFISPSLPLNFVFKVVTIGKLQGRQDKEINALFINHFRENNWQNLELMVKSWQYNKVLGKRYKILIDCVKAIKLSETKRVNVSNAILPTLITQIDGAMSDFLVINGIPWQVDYDDVIDRKTEKVRKVGRKSQLKSFKPNVLPSQLDELAVDVCMNILFQKSSWNKGHTTRTLETPFNFNRHKIIHGQSVRYGRIDYMVRTFMVLDLIAHWAEPG